MPENSKLINWSQRELIIDFLAKTWQPLLRSESLSGKCTKLHTVPESNKRDHTLRSLYSIIACLCHIYVGVVLCHIPFVVNRTINTAPTERLQQHPLLFTTNRTNRTFFLWSLHLAQPSHLGHSTILLQSGSPSGKCAKLAVSNNRDNTPRPLYYCLFVAHTVYMGVVLCAHLVRGESHIQHNASGKVATPLKLEGQSRALKMRTKKDVVKTRSEK